MPRDQIIELIQEVYGPSAQGVQMSVYRKPYPEWIDRTYEFPRGYNMPDFSLFNGKIDQSTIEHIARFTTQCGEFTNYDFMKFKLFPNSLSEPTFIWYTSLLVESILN